MIIPAFGVSTGGLNITDKAISKLFSNTPDVYFCYKRNFIIFMMLQIYANEIEKKIKKDFT